MRIKRTKKPLYRLIIVTPIGLYILGQGIWDLLHSGLTAGIAGVVCGPILLSISILSYIFRKEK